MLTFLDPTRILNPDSQIRLNSNPCPAWNSLLHKTYGNWARHHQDSGSVAGDATACKADAGYNKYGTESRLRSQLNSSTQRKRQKRAELVKSSATRRKSLLIYLLALRRPNRQILDLIDFLIFYNTTVLRIRIRRIHMFLGLPDPDPAPDPSIIMQK